MSIPETTLNEIEIVKDYLENFPHNKIRNQRDEDWKRGADYVRTQTLALIEHLGVRRG